MRKIISFQVALFVLVGFSINAQNFNIELADTINPNLLNKPWPAKWITHPDISGIEYGVYQFRKTFSLSSRPEQFIIHISADNRYKLYVNGKYICNGPARGDLMKWRFESLDIAPYLKNGENVITAVVWNFANYRPVAQFSNLTGLIVQGNTVNENILNTDSSWVVFKDSAYSPLPVNIGHYYVVGPGEKFDSQEHPWDWKQTDFDDSHWKAAKELEQGTPLKSHKQWGSPARHVLIPRKIPLMEEKPQSFAKIPRTDLSNIPDQFFKGKKEFQIPSSSKIKILFDQGQLTNAYPVLTFSNGKSSKIKLTYAESLFNDKLEKGNRNEIENKKIIGNHDIIIPDGGLNRVFETLWWRTFRYIEMEIETKDEPLIINAFNSIFTGYPFAEKASFKCDDPVMTDIWNVGWHTQRLCAGETFFDCPYYEQLQYVGDTRIQALVSSYVSGDKTLIKSAIESINDSRLSFGLTQSRYPSHDPQIIPPFSLIWITMIYDYWMLNGDQEFIKSLVPGIMDVLNWYKARIDTTATLGPVEWWNFVDWVNYDNWSHGAPPGVYNNNSAIISLQYVYTLQKAALIFNAFDLNNQARQYLDLAEKIKSAVLSSCYDKKRELLADTPEKSNFSQHANVLAILTDTFSKEQQTNVFNKINNKKDIAQCSYYYRYYLTEAAQKAGLAGQYPDMLEPWKQMLDNGLTTFAEEPEPSRSDCHAWSASPLYYFLSLVCGIKPAEPGFKSVKFEPNLGRLNWIEGSMPHSLGTISVSLKRDNQNNLSGKVILPENLEGVFIWNGQRKKLNGGINLIQ